MKLRLQRTRTLLLLASTLAAAGCDEEIEDLDPDHTEIETVVFGYATPSTAAEPVEIVAAEEDSEEVVVIDVDVYPDGKLDITAISPDPEAGYAANSFCTSWHCTKVSMNNVAGMPNGSTVWMGVDAYHTNNSIDFNWTRLEHVVCNYGNSQCYFTLSCTVSGDWSTGAKRYCSKAAEGLDGWTIFTRLCADIKDDGKGTRCTNYAVAKAVW